MDDEEIYDCLGIVGDIICFGLELSYHYVTEGTIYDMETLKYVEQYDELENKRQQDVSQPNNPFPLDPRKGISEAWNKYLNDNCGDLNHIIESGVKPFVGCSEIYIVDFKTETKYCKVVFGYELKVESGEIHARLPDGLSEVIKSFVTFFYQAHKDANKFRVTTATAGNLAIPKGPKIFNFVTQYC